uniref:Pectinesterase inhibitor domain-containing protein n=1 Tax=Aegilops tauschii TaxID=37682 RepID=M8C8Y7_AEGTA
MAPSPSSSAAVLAMLVLLVLLGMGYPAAAATASLPTLPGRGLAAQTAAGRRHACYASKRTNGSARCTATVLAEAKQVVHMTVKALAQGLAATSPAGAASAPSRLRARPARPTTRVGAHHAAPLTASPTASSYDFPHSSLR